jgi:hypothetical protein
MQEDGGTNSLQEPQFLPLVDTALNLTAVLATLTFALAALVCSNGAEPAATPPMNSNLRETGVEPSV